MSTQSRWIAIAATTAVAALGMGQASAQSYAQSGHYNRYGFAQMVRCESVNSRRRFCRVDTRSGVQIVRRLSRNACRQGRNWGYNARGIWVSNGCRAEFRILGRRGDRYNSNDRNYNNDRRGNSSYVTSSGQVLQCDSTGNGRTYCHTESNRRYMLGRSRAGNCVEGQTWGTDDRGLWVSGDCRGDFNYQH
jgi:hypothetical protein